MPFEIVRNDITNMRVDAIVNTANPRPVIGSGTDSMINEKAGPKLLAARKQIGDIACGNAVATPAFDLQAKYTVNIFHAFLRGTTFQKLSFTKSAIHLLFVPLKSRTSILSPYRKFWDTKMYHLP